MIHCPRVEVLVYLRNYSSSKKKTVTFLFHSAHPDGIALFMIAVPFPFHMHAYTISNWVWSFNVQKMKGQLVHSPTRIDSFILPWSSKLFWGSSLLPLFDFERVLQLRLDWVWSPLSTIDRPRIANWLWSPPNAIAWMEQCFFWLS